MKNYSKFTFRLVKLGNLVIKEKSSIFVSPFPLKKNIIC